MLGSFLSSYCWEGLGVQHPARSLPHQVGKWAMEVRLLSTHCCQVGVTLFATMDTTGKGQFFLWCLARVGWLLSKRFSVLLSLPFPYYLTEGSKLVLGPFYWPPIKRFIGSFRLKASPVPHLQYIGGKKSPPRQLTIVVFLTS